MESQASKEILFSIDFNNKKCAECRVNDSLVVSVNNGITLCEQCAYYHTSLGNQISYLRPISAGWDDYLLGYFLNGGNSRFHSDLKALGVNNDSPIKIKYRTNGLNFYRINLKLRTLGRQEIQRNFDDPNQVFPNIDKMIFFPEFENYKLKRIFDDIEKIENSNYVNTNTSTNDEVFVKNYINNLIAKYSSNGNNNFSSLISSVSKESISEESSFDSELRNAIEKPKKKEENECREDEESSKGLLKMQSSSDKTYTNENTPEISNNNNNFFEFPPLDKPKEKLEKLYSSIDYQNSGYTTKSENDVIDINSLARYQIPQEFEDINKVCISNKKDESQTQKKKKIMDPFKIIYSKNKLNKNNE